ncbi:hypothetical protein P9112_000603 [Eukaryota sp. TZLM1-RC]
MAFIRASEFQYPYPYHGLHSHDVNSPSENERNPPTQKSYDFPGNISPSIGKSNLPHKESPSIEKSNLPRKETPQESELPAQKSFGSQKGSHFPNKERDHHGDDDSELYAPFPYNPLEILPCRKYFLTASTQLKYRA